MPLREPRLELDRREINSILGWSGVSIPSIANFVMSISLTGVRIINGFCVYNRGEVILEDTERREKKCWMISIWTAPAQDKNSEVIFQQPVPIKVRYSD